MVPNYFTLSSYKILISNIRAIILLTLIFKLKKNFTQYKIIK